MSKIEINELIKVESSNIDMIGFNGNTTYIQFKGGAIYSYPNTSEEEFNKLAYSKSVGGYFAQTYRHKKEFNKLEDIELVQIESKAGEFTGIVTLIQRS